MKIFELTPTSGRKSFYGKAKVIEENNTAKLISYTTVVAEYDLISREFKVNGDYSVTTKGHIRAFKSFYSV